MCTTAAISRLLSKSDFGLYILVQTTINTLGIVAGFGLGTLVTRYAAALRESDRPRLARILTLGKFMVCGFGTLATLSMFGASGIIADRVFHNPVLTNMLRLSCAAMFFTTIDNYQKSVLIGFERLRDVAVVSSFSALLTVGISAALTYFYSAPGAAASIAVSGFVQSMFSYIALKKLLSETKLHAKSKDWRKETPLLASFAFPALVANLLIPGAMWLSQAMLGRQQGGYDELAIYGIAIQWFNALLFVPNIANRILMPLLSELTEKRNSKGLAEIVKYALITNFLLTTSFVAIFLSLSDLVLRVYGRTYPSGHQVLVMIGVAAIIASLMNVPGNLLSAHSQMWLGSLMNFGWATIYVVGSLILVKQGWGARGLAVSLVGAYIAHFAWSSVWMTRKMRWNIMP